MRGESGRVAERVRGVLAGFGPDETADDASTAASPASQHADSGLAPWRRWAARVRLDPGRRAALAVGAAVLVAAVATGAWVAAERPRPVAVSESPVAPSPTARSSPSSAARPRTSAAAGPAAASSGGSGGAAQVVVDVAGKVHRPGLYRLPAGARVDDAVRAAGGPLAGVNLASLNLAARVVDGVQIRVGLPGAAVSAPAAGSAPADGSSAGGTAGATSVDVNTAGSEQLQTLPGVGPVLAQHILDWRNQHGQFTSVAQLQDVSGIGPAKYAAIKGLVTL